ncbi:TetR/AcrR family transcriptional regulator [Collinsella tanakaei]|nr:TetR/AcrR family transcriptional regulator [Collinsella tanakaei]
MFSKDEGKRGSMSDRFGRFENLPEDRRRAIVDAAFEVFGGEDYARASTADIARRAGVSKSQLFFYFRNKRELYLYVLGVLTRRVADAVVDERWYEIDDFFEIMRYAVTRKACFVGLNPRVTEFFVRAFYLGHRDVSGTLDAFMKDAVPAMVQIYLGHVRWDRFREGVDPMRVVRMLVWCGDGYLHERLRGGGELDMEAMLSEFLVWLDWLKRATYREEYL